MNVPFSAALVSINENLKVMSKPTESNYTFSLYFGCAFIAGALAAVITNPLDVTKTRLQTQNMDMTCISEPEYCKPECLESTDNVQYRNF